MDEFGVYIHVPFCAAKCDYCAFATWTDRHHLVDKYLAALHSDIRRAIDGGLPEATTVFVGGGTPTQVDPRALGEVIAAIPRTVDAEVTVECNPDDVDEQLFTAYRSAGVNRISLGVQSMSPHVLAALGRTHDPDNVAAAVAALRSVDMPSFNLDLIYGSVGETIDDWATTIDDALALDPPHVSAYGLTVEPGTPLAATPDRYPDDDDQADKYELTDDRLVTAGLANYEVSNWARPGHESRHNQLYWAQADYRGFGCAAHSHEAGRRWWNVRTPDRYIDLIERGESVVAAHEQLDDTTRSIEGHQLALRTREGVEAAAFDGTDLDELVGDGLVERVAPTRVVLTRRGRLLANEVALRVQPE